MDHLNLTDDQRFDHLWERFKAELRKACGDRESVYTMRENAVTQRWGSRVHVGTPTADEHGEHFANIHVSTARNSSITAAYAEDMVTMAAHLMASAEEITAANEAKKEAA